MKRISIIMLVLLAFMGTELFGLGSIAGQSKRRDGSPINIGLIVKTTDDPFIEQTIEELSAMARKQHSRVLTRYTSEDGQEQLYELERLYLVYGISTLIIEVADADTMQFVNDFAIRNKIAVLYINEDSELAKENIPEHRRIATYTHSRDYARYQLEFAASYFAKNNIRQGTVLLLYNSNDPAQDKQAKMVIDSFSRKTNRFDIQFASVNSYEDALNTMSYWLTSTENNIAAVFTTNNSLSEWATIAVDNYRSSVSQETGTRARRSERRSRITSRSALSRYRSKYNLTPTNPLLERIENTIVLGNNVNGYMFPIIDEGDLTMAIYRNPDVYAQEILERITLLSRGNNLEHIELYHPDIITSDNIFRYAKEIEEILAREAEEQEIVEASNKKS